LTVENRSPGELWVPVPGMPAPDITENNVQAVAKVVRSGRSVLGLVLG